jgi:UDP-N-acetylglucosamine 4,6-dehydratase/5-epimerase
MTRMDLSDSTILLTGGTGSFGNTFVRHVGARWPTATIRVFSRDELKQHDMRARLGDANLRFVLGDVRDRHRLERAAAGCDYIVHAAAMKQVPACEYNPFEAVQTNVIGAQNVVDVAIDCGVRRAIALSTDKAVNPVNLYGATKLCAEKIIVQGNAYAAGADTRLACVRYGNVIGSRGSVVPVFQRQRDEGRLTITDDRMTRFWITLDEAVELVLYAMERSRGDEIYIPKIPSMKINDLADAVAPGVPREVTGIRPGEKLHELLLTTDEARHAVELEQMYIVMPEHPWWDAGSVAHGKPLHDGFSYASNTNDRWLGVDELVELLG